MRGKTHGRWPRSFIAIAAWPHYPSGVSHVWVRRSRIRVVEAEKAAAAAAAAALQEDAAAAAATTAVAEEALEESGGASLELHMHTVMNIGALPRRCRPKVTRIGTNGLLHSRSAMPWRQTCDLISVV